jgi:hypothetical protein
MESPEGGYLYNPEATEDLFPVREGTDYYNQAFNKGYADLSDTALGIDALTDLFTNIREGRDISRRRKAAQGRQRTLGDVIETWRPPQAPTSPPEAPRGGDSGMFGGYHKLLAPPMLNDTPLGDVMNFSLAGGLFKKFKKKKKK